MLDGLRQRLTRRLEKLSGELGHRGPSVAKGEDVEALRAQGNAHLADGELVLAEEAFRKALNLEPEHAGCLMCLGFVLKEQGRLAEARIFLHRCKTADLGGEQLHEVHYLLGHISVLQGDHADARKHLEESLRLKPDFVHACAELCQLLRRESNLQAAHELLERSVRSSPDCPDYRWWLADVYRLESNFEGLTEQLRVLLDLGVVSAQIYVGLGSALCRLGRLKEAEQYMAEGQAMDPAVAYMVNHELGAHHLSAGNIDLGIQHFEHCIALRPEYLPAHVGLINALSYADGVQAGAYQEAISRYTKLVKGQSKSGQFVAKLEPELKSGAASAKLRIGFVSGDLRKHPVGLFLNDVLTRLDKTKLYLVAYANNLVDDAHTEKLKPLFDEWHGIRELSDDDATELIRSHNIDILLDLGGYTGDGRLPVFARRAAAVQVTWLGYWASTGLLEMDYILADPYCVPEQSQQWFVERVYRMPHTRLCMSIPKTTLPIMPGPPPCMSNSFVTYGSFQQVKKITPQVLAVWAEILTQQPLARLRIQAVELGQTSIREKLQQDLIRSGIDMTRVSVHAGEAFERYLQTHQEIDILLDTFPYTGGTTTSFGLWMGVPTITMAGDSMISRQGESMLRCVGLDEYIAQDVLQYVAVATSAASEPGRLAEWRRKLRAITENSPLFDAQRFARDFEEALFAMRGKRRSPS